MICQQYFKIIAVLLFADDCKMMVKINKAEDTTKFQTEINKLIGWCTNNKIELNISKCAILSLSKNESKTIKAYNMNNSIVNRVNVFRDSGILIVLQ